MWGGKIGSCVTRNVLRPEYDLQVIVPVYNVERYIEACMDSVVSQKTQYSFCVTVVNDGSPDNSRQLLRKYEHLPNVEIIDQENKGFSGARNAALKYLRGEYLTFVDSDDVVPPSAFEALLKEAKATQADIVEGAYDRIDFSGNLLQHLTQAAQRHCKRLRGFPWGKVYKSNLFERLQFPEGYWFEDTINALIIYSLAKEKETISEIVYSHRVNPFSITNQYHGKAKSLDTIYVMRRLLADRALLRLPYDMDCYNCFLMHLRIHYYRTLEVGSCRTIAAVFQEERRLRNLYFANLRTDDESLKEREQALLLNDLHRYAKALR